jgi:hypothetical protein
MPETPIKDSLEQVLKNLPSSGRGFSETAITTNGWRTEIGHRINESWTISAFAGSTWGVKPQAGVLVKGKW